MNPVPPSLPLADPDAQGHWRWWARVVLTGALGVGLLWALLAARALPGLGLGSPAERSHSGPGSFHPPRVFMAGPSPVPWPSFPGGSAAVVRRMTLSGVGVTNEEWTTAAPASAVLAYYRSQMAARGWRDVTEANFRFTPAARPQGASQNGLQDPHFLLAYREMMDSNLVMRRANDSFQITLGRNPAKPGLLSVRICAAGTPSLKQFVEDLSLRFSPRGGGERRSELAAVQHADGWCYRTTLRTEPVETGSAFNTTLARLEGAGWRRVLAGPGGAGGGRAQSAWLAKGASFAVVAVKPGAARRGATVALTEVTPETPGSGGQGKP